MRRPIIFIVALVAFYAVYWAIQPTCRAGEVRVRGLFNTACVVGHGGRIP